MNLRIRQLAEQAKMFATPMKFHLGGQDYARVRDEKFAQLIVAECLDQLIVSDPAEDFDKGVVWSAKQIREHFGVEE